MIPNTIEKTPAGGLPAANCSLFLGDCLEMMKHIPDGPYLELFARRKRHGWHSWGNEVDSDICMPNAELTTPNRSPKSMQNREPISKPTDSKQGSGKGLSVPRLVRRYVTTDIIEGDEWVTCPRCKREDLRSGGWPGLPHGNDWKADCECGQPMLICSPPNDQVEARRE